MSNQILEKEALIFRRWKSTGMSNRELAKEFTVTELEVSTIIAKMTTKQSETRQQVDHELAQIASLECQKGMDTKGTDEEIEINSKISVHLNNIKQLDPGFYKEISNDEQNRGVQPPEEGNI